MKIIESEKKELILFYSLCLVPVFAFFLHLTALLTYSVDIPYLDDWRNLLNGKAGSFSSDLLFLGSNDTMSVTGQLFDSLSIHLIAGNNILGQVISMVTVLGGLLTLQVILLKHFSINKLVLGFAILSTVFMLQSDSYWGLQSIAYNQAIPLICILGLLCILVTQPFKNQYLSAFFVFIISLICGLSYISGAVTLSVVTIWVSALSFKATSEARQRYRFSGIAMLASLLITLPLQLKVILIQQSGQPHRADAPWALPGDMDFWVYILGKVARAIGCYEFSTRFFWISFATIVFTIAIFCFLYVAYKAFLSSDKQNMGLYCVYGTLFLTVIVYLFAVSAGRANLRPDYVASTLEIFSFAQHRFHYFWFTILIPWLILFFGNSIASRFNPEKSFMILVCAVTALTLYMAGNSKVIFNHFDAYKKNYELKTKGLVCIKEKLLNNEEVYCPDLIPENLTKAIDFASRLDLSFTSDLYLKPYQPALLFQLTEESKNSLTLTNATPVINRDDPDILTITADNDSHILLKLKSPDIQEELNSCLVIQVHFKIETDSSREHVQVFYKPKGVWSFNEQDSVRKAYSTDKPESLLMELEITGLNRYSPEIRIDPGDNPGIYKVSNLELRCKII